MIPVSVYLQYGESDAPQYRQLFQQMFHESPAVGSFVRVHVAERMDVYLVTAVYHDFAMSPHQGPLAQPISIVVTKADETPSASNSHSVEEPHTMKWDTALGSITRSR